MEDERNLIKELVDEIKSHNDDFNLYQGAEVEMILKDKYKAIYMAPARITFGTNRKFIVSNYAGCGKLYASDLLRNLSFKYEDNEELYIDFDEIELRIYKDSDETELCIFRDTLRSFFRTDTGVLVLTNFDINDATNDGFPRAMFNNLLGMPGRIPEPSRLRKPTLKGGERLGYSVRSVIVPNKSIIPSISRFTEVVLMFCYVTGIYEIDARDMLIKTETGEAIINGDEAYLHNSQESNLNQIVSELEDLYPALRAMFNAEKIAEAAKIMLKNKEEK